MTPERRFGSIVFAICTLGISTGYGHAQGESCLGVSDTGIFSDLDARVQIALPTKLAPERVSATIDRDHQVLVLAIDGAPRKAYPLGGTSPLKVGRFELALRPGDCAELRPLLAESRVREGT